MKELKNDIRHCFDLLIDQDGNLFENPIVRAAPYDERKLHEVCINHRLAIHFENIIVPKLRQDKFYVDIEFNREGINIKAIGYDGQKDLVRPDIIIHNRRSGDKKNNFLVVECKKINASDKDKETDIKKLESFITDKKYMYKYGLQAIYGKQKVSGKLIYLKDGNIEKEII